MISSKISLGVQKSRMGGRSPDHSPDLSLKNHFSLERVEGTRRIY